MARIWVADTEPNQRFTMYTRGNVGEVFPHVMTALTGTLIGDAVRQGQVEVFVEMGVLRRHEVTGPSVGTGVFGGYLYMSGSALRLFGVRMPGMSPRDADEQVMGEVTDVPPYRRARGDRNLIATLTLSRYVLKLLRSPDLGPLDLARADARAWLATMPDLRSATDEQLLRWLASYPPRQAASMKRLLEFSMLAGAPRGLLDRFLARVAAPPGMANRIVGGTGDIDSAQLAQQLWALGRLVAADAALSDMFDGGLDGIEVRTRHTPLQPAVDAFLSDQGHRGNDEYELASPAWVMDPAPVYAAVDRLRRADADRDPVVIARRLAADSDTALDEATALGAATHALDAAALRHGLTARVDRSRAGQGHPRAREPRRPPRAPRTGSSSRRAGWTELCPRRLLRHRHRARRLRRPTDRVHAGDRRAVGPAARPRRADPSTLVRRSHPRSGHLAAAGDERSCRARRRRHDHRHRRQRRRRVRSGPGDPGPWRPPRARAR